MNQTLLPKQNCFHACYYNSNGVMELAPISHTYCHNYEEPYEPGVYPYRTTEKPLVTSTSDNDFYIDSGIIWCFEESDAGKRMMEGTTKKWPENVFMVFECVKIGNIMVKKAVGEIYPFTLQNLRFIQF